MQKWFDTHCHLDRLPEEISLAETLQRARAVGVSQIVVPGVSGAPGRLKEMSSYDEIRMAWGILPGFGDDKKLLLSSEPWVITGCQPVAIGECGLDRRCDMTVDDQCHLFRQHLLLAKKAGLPLIVHLVGHYQRAFTMLEEMRPLPAVVLHSWSGSAAMAARFVKSGAMISLSASCLKNRAKLGELLQAIDLDSLLLETDSPDMKPEFWAGSCNEPAAIAEIGAAVAEVGEIEVAKLAEILYTNSVRIFGKW